MTTDRRIARRDRLIAEAIRKGVLPARAARRYREMFDRDPIATQQLLIRLEKVAGK